MYVCVCRAVTCHEVRRAIGEGASTMRDLRRELGVCSDCGKCGPCAREILAEETRAASEPVLAFPAAQPA